ncbi:MAG: Dam family site-specific DNA-(adenine-N6)-methyltransferase [Candidatus Babeliaceae bacterium]|nr:Dam family site-specific DNA-(adenine-N6)-methyltransferase [Candidatus Babeliaceae bacterium]
MQKNLFNIADAKNRYMKTSETHQPISLHYHIKNVGKYELDKVYYEDCIEGMKNLPSESIDVAIADPPYNLSKGGNWKWDNSIRLPGFGGNWSKVMAEWDDMPLAEYFNFTLAWLAELKRVVRPSGSLWIHGTYHNIGIINFALQLLEIEIINEIVWYKRNSFPNLSGRRLTASHETILWAHTGKAKNRKYYFAYDKSKNLACPEDLLKEKGKQMRTVWDIPNNKMRDEIQFGKHPTQKPIRLLTRMLQISADKGHALLVPFAGSGSDCVAAKYLGIRFLAFENDSQYVEICRKRLEKSEIPGRLIENKKKNQKEEVLLTVETLHTPRAARAVPSLIKWTGSKRSQAGSIASLIPKYRRYFEPFLGGGAVLYFTAVPDSVAGDLYEPLIHLWRLIQAEPDKVVEDYKLKWMSLKEELDGVDVNKWKRGNGIPKYYYEVRKRFNEQQAPLDLNFLMRTCVNGIVRFNDDGKFNNSFHLSRRGMEPQRFKSIVDSWHSVIQGVNFMCQDYLKTVAMAEKDDFVYFDPPYAGNRQRYIEDLDLDRLFSTLEDLNRREVKWALSFDGRRGTKVFSCAVPESLFKRQLLLSSGNSSVNKVLNGPVEDVEESLYLNF